MRILISAAEASSDIHGAKLLAELKKRVPHMEAFGIGGPMLLEAGLRPIADARTLLAMGFAELITRLPAIAFAFFKLKRELKSHPPDLAVVIDYPDFHFRLTRVLNRLQVPVVYYIPPKVWAWRKHRVNFLRERYAKVLSIFPFELEFLKQNGVNVQYVGNPLLDELPLDLSKDKARAIKGISPDFKGSVVTLMAGSRPSELKWNLETLLEAADLIAQKTRVIALMPFPRTANFEEQSARVKSWRGKSQNLEIRVSQGDAHICMKASDAGMIKSGTSTLEAAILGLPHGVIYKASKFTEWLFYTFINYKGAIALSNLVRPSGKSNSLTFRELKGSQATPETVSRELESLLFDRARRHEQEMAISEVRAALQLSQSLGPSAEAAVQILDVFKSSKQGNPQIGLLGTSISVLWSTINWVRRRICKGAKLGDGIKVISVGNIQAGGTGKTPLVIALANWAKDQGFRVGILTRGYKSKWESRGGVVEPLQKAPTDAGDEVQVIRQEAPHAWIGVGSDRLGIFQRSKPDVDFVILDDGFQNFKIAKDFEVLAVSTHKEKFQMLRDFWSEAQFADAVVWTKGRLAPGWLKCQKANPTLYIVNGKASGKPLTLFTGVGSPDQVRQMLEDEGYRISSHHILSDHEAISGEKLLGIQEESLRKQTQIACTLKDFVKLNDVADVNEILVFDLKIVPDPDLFKLIQKRLGGK